MYFIQNGIDPERTVEKNSFYNAIILVNIAQ